MATTIAPDTPITIWQKLFEERKTSFIQQGCGKLLDISSEDAFRRSLETLCAEYGKQAFPKLLAKLSPTFHHIKSYANAIGAAAQGQMFAAIVWGGLFAVIECGCKFGETLDGIADLLVQLNSAIPLFNANLALHPDAEVLQDPLRSIFREYSEFCLFAVNFFNKGSVARFVGGFRSSTPQKRLKDTKEKIETFTKEFQSQLDVVRAAEAKRHQLAELTMLGNMTADIHRLKLPESSLSNNSSQSLASALRVSNTRINTAPPQNPQFLGRENILEELDKRLWPVDVTHTSASQLNSCILLGMAGVGKTQTAQEYTHRFREKYTNIFWIRAEEEPDRIKDFCRIARREDSHTQNDIDYAREWLETTGQDWLLVFDNVESWKDIATLWPVSSLGHGSIIITTKTKLSSPLPNSTIPIEPMDLLEGSRLLFLHSEQPFVENEVVQRILELAGGLPLIIAIIGAYIRVTAISMEEFVDLYNSSPDVLWSGRGWRDAWQYESNEQPGKVFRMALQKLSKNPRELINILGFLNPDAIQEQLLLADHTDPSLRFLRNKRNSYTNMIYDLRELSLVKQNTDPITGARYLSIHRVVQDYIIYSVALEHENQCTASDEAPKAFNQAFQIVRRATPAPDEHMQPTPHQQDAYDMVLPQILSLQAVYERLDIDSTIDFARLLSDAGMHMWASGLTRDGLRLLESAEGVLNRISYDEESPVRATINTIIGVLNDNVGISQRAESLRRRQKALHNRQMAKARTAPDDFTRTDDILLHNAWADLGCSYLQYNRYLEAEEIWDRCLLKYREWGPPEMKELAYEYAKYNHHMAFVRIYQGKREEAVELAKLGVHHMAISTTPKSSLTYRYKFDLACIVLQTGDKEESLALHKEVLRTRSLICGKYNELTLQSCYTVGALNDYCGDLDQAEYWIREALDRQRTAKSFWSEESIARARFHLSEVLTKLGKDPEEASTLRTKALNVANKLLPDDQTSVLKHVGDKMVLFDHMVPVFDGRFTGLKILDYLTLGFILCHQPCC